MWQETVGNHRDVGEYIWNGPRLMGPDVCRTTIFLFNVCDFHVQSSLEFHGAAPGHAALPLGVVPGGSSRRASRINPARRCASEGEGA